METSDQRAPGTAAGDHTSAIRIMPDVESAHNELGATNGGMATRHKAPKSLSRSLRKESAEPIEPQSLLQKYRTFSSNLRDIILFVRPDGRIVEANDEAVSAYGYTRDELVSLTIYDLRAPADGDTVTAQMAAANGGGILFETMHYRKDGSSFPVEVSSRGADIGGERLLLSVVRDITSRRKAEKALRESERRFQALAALSPVGVFRTDANGMCTYVNERWCQIAGIDADTASGHGWMGSLHPEDRDRVLDDWNQAIEDGREFAGEFRFVHSDGRVTWVMGQARTERADGRIAGYVGTITDITRRKEAEEALECAYEREHRIAAVLQAALIPPSRGRLGNLVYDVRYQPAWKEADVGGDFCEVAIVGEDLAVVALGDVSGKGLDAAVYGSMAKNMLLGFATEGPDPGRVLTRLNDALCSQVAEDHFATLACMFVDLKNGIVSYSSAGHEPLIRLSRATGKTEELEPTGQALGLAPGAAYGVDEIHLEHGDIVFAYTDGLSEAGSRADMLQAEGLAGLLRENLGKSLGKIHKAIYDAATTMTRSDRLTDDAASVMLRWKK